MTYEEALEYEEVVVRDPMEFADVQAQREEDWAWTFGPDARDLWAELGEQNPEAVELHLDRVARWYR